VRSKVENILYSYSTLDRDIKELEQELEDMAPNLSTSLVIFNHNSRGNQDSKQERMMVSRRYERASNRLDKLKRIVAAVEEAKQNLNHRELTIIELKYDKMMQHQQVARQIGVTVRHYYRIRDAFLDKMSLYLTMCGIIYIMVEV
jgi:DNA-directed RNA polymerase specialized sigma subunit